MIIALEESLSAFRSILEQAGHRVVPLYGFYGAVDAVVYDKENMLSHSTNSIINESGIFMICAHGLSSNQLLKILEERTYGENGILF